MAKTRVYYHASGHLGQYEDWWWLVQEDDGSVFVDHEWDHVSVNSLAKNDGEIRYSLEDGLRKAPDAAVAKIKAILGL